MNEAALPEVAKEILTYAEDRRVWVITGDLGAGKTNLIKKVCALLGCEDEITSPTFSLVNEYEIENGIIYHMDLYRLNDIEEALNIGMEEYLESGAYCFIEWPEMVEPLLPEDAVKIKIEILNDSSRKILFL